MNLLNCGICSKLMRCITFLFFDIFFILLNNIILNIEKVIPKNIKNIPFNAENFNLKEDDRSDAPKKFDNSELEELFNENPI